jgi:hypothetical protein
MELRMRFTRLSSVAAGVVSFLVAPSGAAFAQAVPTNVGTWQLNLAQSSFDPGPPPKSLTITRRLEKSAGGGEGTVETINVTIERVNADGGHNSVRYTASYDGKDYPRIGDPLYDSIALKRIDAYTIEETLKKAGKVLTVIRQVVSRDGKVLTGTETGINANGQSVHNVRVYDKQ